MTLPDVLSDLRPLLSDWRTQATEYIVANLNELTVVARGATWTQVGQNQYQASDVTLILNREAPAKLQMLPAYQELDNAVKESVTFAPLLGRLVGTERSKSLFSTWTLANAFIPPINHLATGHAESFMDRYIAVNHQLNEQQIKYHAICPIQGAGFRSDLIDLASNLAIARMNPYQVRLALESGAMPTMFSSTFTAEDNNSFALIKTISVPVIVRDSRPQSSQSMASTTLSPFVGLVTAANEIIELQQCLALLSSERIQVSAVLIAAEDGGFLLTDRKVQLQPISTSWRADTGLRFDVDACADIQKLWKVSHGEDLPRYKALGLAVRRLGIATQRTITEDRLLDVFIAAEAFYLTEADGSKDRRRITSRLCQRAALWSEGTSPAWSADEVRQQMRCGYDIRSAVAHGGEADPADIKVKDEQVSLAELVQAIEGIVRDGVYKAVSQLSGSDGRLSVPWHDVASPEPPQTPDQPHSAGAPA